MQSIPEIKERLLVILILTGEPHDRLYADRNSADSGPSRRLVKRLLYSVVVEPDRPAFMADSISCDNKGLSTNTISFVAGLFRECRETH